MKYLALPYLGPPRDKIPAIARFLNKAGRKLRFPLELRPRFDHRNHMLSIEQATNFQLLIERLLDTDVPGAFVELGSYTGSSAAVIGSLIQHAQGGRAFHVYDRFDIEIGSQRNIQEVFKQTLTRACVPLPTMHVGDLHATVPAELPERIAFAHIDCGIGGGAQAHAALITHCLNALYPRLTQNAVVVLMDYHDPARTLDGNDSNPGVRQACDAFFADKPEQVQGLYGGPCSHAYIRKR